MSGDQKYRASWHDYRAKCIYFLTMKKSPMELPFGTLVGTPESAHVDLTPLGKIVRNAIYNISRIEPKVRLFQYAMMPDHAHFLLSVEQILDDPLGLLIARLKAEINHGAGHAGVFQEGFNDQILRADRSLDAIFTYIRDNPRRLAMRRANPEYFRRIANTDIASHPCMLYGNLDLLTNPFKQQVIVHRADTDTEFFQNKARCLYTGINGGVLVSPFISPREHMILDEAEAEGARFIKLTPTPLGPRQKPAGREYRLCSEGRLLIAHPLDLPACEGKMSRRQALLMNDLAAAISKN